jgi:hypothetical protein
MKLAAVAQVYAVPGHSGFLRMIKSDVPIWYLILVSTEHSDFERFYSFDVMSRQQWSNVVEGWPSRMEESHRYQIMSTCSFSFRCTESTEDIPVTLAFLFQRTTKELKFCFENLLAADGFSSVCQGGYPRMHARRIVE